MTMGPKEAVDQGYVNIIDYHRLSRSINLYQLDQQQPHELSEERGIWLYGPPRVGKSMLANNHFGKVYKKDQSKWWDGYNGEPTVILEDLDKHGGPQLAHHLKIWTDVYSLAGEIKGGKVALNYERFIVTSNYSINRIYGPNEKMSQEEREDAEVMCQAIKSRFKEVHIESR